MPFIACLSPDAMQLSAYIGYEAAVFCFGVSFASVLVSWRQRSLRWLPLCGLLLLLHPAWTMSERSGDCGYVKRFFSVAVCFVFLTLLIRQTCWPDSKARRFFLFWTVVTWLVYLPLFVSHTFHLPFAPTEGIIAELVQPYVFASRGLFQIALTLSFVSILLWLLDRNQVFARLPKISRGAQRGRV
jgi:hypothetical protein